MFYLDTVVLSAKAGLHESRDKKNKQTNKKQNKKINVYIYERFRFRFRFLFLISFEKKKNIFVKLGINLK